MRNACSLLAAFGMLLAWSQAGAQDPSIVLDDGGIRFPDGTLLNSAAGSYANVVVVAKSGGHYTSIGRALGSITDASETNPYLVWVGPGIYEERVVMKPWVDIQGAGKGVTRITSPWNGLAGADDAELRFLTVETTGLSNYAFAILNMDASPRLSHVQVIASGFKCTGVDNVRSRPSLADVDVEVDGDGCFGIANDRASPLMTNVDVSISGWGSGTGWGIIGVTGWNSSPQMKDVTITASSTYADGLVRGMRFSGGSSPTLTNVNVSVRATSAGTKARGVEFDDSSSAVMSNVVATAIAGATSPPAAGIGVYSSSTSRLILRGSHLMGAGAAIHLESSASAQVEHSKLEGPATGSGSYTCFSVCDVNLYALGRNCQPPP